MSLIDLLIDLCFRGCRKGAEALQAIETAVNQASTEEGSGFESGIRLLRGSDTDPILDLQVFEWVRSIFVSENHMHLLLFITTARTACTRVFVWNSRKLCGNSSLFGEVPLFIAVVVVVVLLLLPGGSLCGELRELLYRSGSAGAGVRRLSRIRCHKTSLDVLERGCHRVNSSSLSCTPS